MDFDDSNDFIRGALSVPLSLCEVPGGALVCTAEATVERGAREMAHHARFTRAIQEEINSSEIMLFT